MPGSQDEAGSPRPLMKTMSCFCGDDGGLMAGKKVCEIGAEGLLGIVKSSGEGGSDIISDDLSTVWSLSF